MHKVCIDCAHRQIPKILKNKFDFMYYPLFSENHPMKADDQIVGCTRKYININWQGFLDYCIDNDFITDEEMEELEQDGWKRSNKNNT